MSPTLVRYDVAEQVATITLDAPDKRNALSVALSSQLAEALDRAADQPDVRAVVLTHSGSVFCSGGDLSELHSHGFEAGARDAVHLLAQIAQLPKPVIGVVRGPARAGGTGLLAACDLVLAADDVSFAFSEVRIGVAPALISLVLLPRLEPRGASRYLLSGATFDARTAVGLGLITCAVPAEAVDEELARWLDDFRQCAPAALAETKSLLGSSLRREISDRGDEMVELSARLFASDEGREGMRAFLDKRLPAWRQ